MFNLNLRYQRFKNYSKFSKEITLIITIKLFLLYFLWWLCFSTPISKTIDQQKFANQLFSSQGSL